MLLEKLDGSMIHPALVEGRLVLMTRMGRTDVARSAEAFALDHPHLAYKRFCRAMLNDCITPIFEYVTPDNRIVIAYPERAMILTGMRRIREGSTMMRHEAS